MVCHNNAAATGQLPRMTTPAGAANAVLLGFACAGTQCWPIIWRFWGEGAADNKNLVGIQRPVLLLLLLLLLLQLQGSWKCWIPNRNILVTGASQPDVVLVTLA